MINRIFEIAVHTLYRVVLYTTIFPAAGRHAALPPRKERKKEKYVIRGRREAGTSVPTADHPPSFDREWRVA